MTPRFGYRYTEHT